MTAVIILLVFINFIKAVKIVPSSYKSVTAEFNLENYKVIGELNFLHSKYWTGYSKLLAVQESDALCKDNKYIIFPEASTKNVYYLCQNGRKELYQCLEGFEFDRSKFRCTPQNYYLNKNHTANDCFLQMDGFYPDISKECREYFRCSNGIKTEILLCPTYQSFSFHLQMCRPENEVLCVSPSCQFASNEYYVLPGSKCQAYYYCAGSIRLDFLCPRGTIYSWKAKNCVESGICYEPVCAGRIDGIYTDTTQDCNRFFECKGGVLQKVNNCPPGQKHNGYSCIPPPFSNCEKPEKTAAAFYFLSNDECKTLQDGSHIVPGTDCQNVKVCLRGKTVATLVCPKDQRFHENRCYPKNMTPCDDICSLKNDGFYADELTDCQGYFLCLNSRVSKRNQCPNGSAFNGFTCTSKNLVLCSRKYELSISSCTGLRDGFHPDYLNGCRNYFYCYNNQIVFNGSCPPGMTWDGEQCTQSENIICEGPTELLECDGLAPGLYQNKTSGCTRYFYCNNGSGTVLSCLPGQIFNGKKCINADEHTCLSTDDCFNKPDGYRQDENTGCRSYYYCSNGNKITYVCPKNLIFNGSYCVSTKLYKCPFDLSRDCIGKNDGYHPDISSECKKYFYCFKGEKLTTLICGGKKIFNGKGCVLSEDPKSECFGNLENPCLEKKDGLFPDNKSDCRKYFQCKNKKLLQENWCPDGFGFDGKTCVKDFLCSRKLKSTSCAPNQIGFFQDLGSNCKNYYFCLGEYKTVATCPEGTIFNGQLCIDSNYYICPSENS